MNCSGFQKRLFEYLDGTLSLAKSRAAKNHLRQCRACRETLRDQQEVAEILTVRLERGAEAISWDAQLEKRIATALRREFGDEKSASRLNERIFILLRRRFALPLGVAVTLLVVGLLAVHVFLGDKATHTNRAQSVDRAQPEMAFIRVSYAVPTYTFRREGNLVTDALTLEMRAEEGSLLVKE